MKSISVGRHTFLILSFAAPLLYFSMYLPIWGGKEFVNANSLSQGFLIFQAICFLLAIAHLVLILIQHEKTIASVIFGIFAILSMMLLCFAALIFVLELLNIDWFPAQK